MLSTGEERLAGWRLRTKALGNSEKENVVFCQYIPSSSFPLEYKANLQQVQWLLQSETLFGRSQNIKRCPDYGLHQIKRLLIFIEKNCSQVPPTNIGKICGVHLFAEALKLSVCIGVLLSQSNSCPVTLGEGKNKRRKKKKRKAGKRKRGRNKRNK